MSWSRAKIIARRYLDRMTLPDQLRGARIFLSDFETEEDHRFLKPGDTWGLEFHRMVNRAIQRDLQRRGAEVSFVTIKMADYFDWLAKNNLVNDPATRAQFVAEAGSRAPSPRPSYS